jgi:hypothetical protein
MRLRVAEADAARRILAEALRAVENATCQVISAKEAMIHEGVCAPADAAHPLAGAYAIWLPSGKAAVADAHAAEAASQAGFEASRAALADARLAVRACEMLAEAQAAHRRAEMLKGAQIVLEDGARGARRP